MDQPAEKPSRRDVLGIRMPQSEAADPATADVEYGPLFHFSSNAMGCQFQVLCTAEARQALAANVSDGFDLIQHLEQQLSIYRDSSEVSRINRLAFQEPVSVERALYRLLQMACRISKSTNGAFDITATPLSRLWKACRATRGLPAEAQVADARSRIGYQHLTFDDRLQTIRFDKTQIEIDLGGIGKGYALDRLKQHLINSGCHDFLIHGGQSSVISCGRRSNRFGSHKHPWQVAISNPLTPGVRLATVNLSDQAIGTSGSGRQHHVVEGKRYGHIIDPRTGWPADQLLSVTVIGESAVLADALATAIFVVGADQARSICDEFDVAAVLVSNEGRIFSTLNLPEEQIQFSDD